MQAQLFDTSNILDPFESRWAVPQGNPTKPQLELFCTIIKSFYEKHERPFVWRHIDDPYHVLVSEIMLQQTQTARAISKFIEFTTRFPTLNTLADASLHDVLSVWKGLGYNRRAQSLHKLAQIVAGEMNGIIPNTMDALVKLPGVGPGTAGAVMAYAFCKPTVFIETNIRTVFIHFFFRNQSDVNDKQLMTLIESTSDQNDPRNWYYALTDYGVALKAALPNPSRKSKHHAKQSKFEGSDRQIRGKILELLLKNNSTNLQELLMAFASEPAPRLERITKKLVTEGMIIQSNNTFTIPH